MKPHFTIVLMDWYYSKNDTQLGPIPTEELQAKIESGEVLDADLVWREGMSDWQPVASLDELKLKSDSLPTGAPPIPVSQPALAPGQPYPVVRTSGLAIASLICGVIGVMGFFACFLPALVGIGGVICGHLALKEIRESAGKVEGRGMAIAGLVMGYVSIVIMVLGILVFVVFGVFSNQSSSSSTYEYMNSMSVDEAPAVDRDNEF